MASVLSDYAPTLSAVVVEYVNRARKGVNGLCIGLEPWQVIAYTVSLTCIILWLRRQLKSDRALTVRLRQGFFKLFRRLPWVQKAIEKELVKARADIQQMIHENDVKREFYMFLPDNGLSMADIMLDVEEYSSMRKFKYLEGRVSGAVYSDQSEEFLTLLNKVFARFAYTNPLHPDVFPDCRKMEAEVVRMVCNLYHGGKRSCGTVSAGGTESILLACLAYRNRAYDMGVSRPEILVAETAHAAFDKAGELFRIKVTHIPLNPHTLEVDIRAMTKAINSNTCLLVGSAPNFPHGVIDPIDEISRLGQRFGIAVHVDACLGGFIVPFMEQCGFVVKPFDFRLTGVTSISCDTHKYAFAPKGTSLVMYRDEELLHYQFFCAPDWCGGIYASPTLGGSRSGCNIALCWATLLFHGKQGYFDSTTAIVESTRAIRDGLAQMDSVRVLGAAEVSVVAFTSDLFNIYQLADDMSKRGWNLNSLQNPAAVHICVTQNQTKPGVVDAFLADVRQVAQHLIDNPGPPTSKTAAIYGMAKSVPDKSIVAEVAFAFLDSCYSTVSPRKQSVAATDAAAH